MTRLLILGATGRTGAAILTALPAGVEATAALRDPTDANRLATTEAELDHAVVDVADPASLRRAMRGVDAVVNAIRLREDIAHTELIAVHEVLLSAGQKSQGDPPTIMTIGGAGALRLAGGQRFWETPAFPRPTLPRGRAHAALRDHLEAGYAGRAWTYLIPPPVYDPDGATTGLWERTAPDADESSFTGRAISYADFGAAVADAASAALTGTHLIAWPH